MGFYASHCDCGNEGKPILGTVSSARNSFGGTAEEKMRHLNITLEYKPLSQWGKFAHENLLRDRRVHVM
jgi:hypothetical protein